MGRLRHELQGIGQEISKHLLRLGAVGLLVLANAVAAGFSLYHMVEGSPVGGVWMLPLPINLG